MSTLPDDRVTEIAKSAANANSINFANISLATTTASTRLGAIASKGVSSDLGDLS